MLVLQLTFNTIPNFFEYNTGLPISSVYIARSATNGTPNLLLVLMKFNISVQSVSTLSPLGLITCSPQGDFLHGPTEI